MKRIIIALVACATVALAGVAWIGGSDKVSHAKAGEVAKFTSPIVGGYEVAPDNKYPWMVRIRSYSNDGISVNCGGVIIGPEWVLTSAKCLQNAIAVEVLAGTNYVFQSGPSAISQYSLDFLLHENFDNLWIQNNIGIIRLPEPLSFNNEIQAINLDSSGNDWAGQVATLAGWGEGDVRLEEIQTPILTNAECAGPYPDIVTPGIGCTSGTGDPGSPVYLPMFTDGIGPCSGDEGGPVLIGNTLVGIMSFNSLIACDASLPSGFTRVSYYRDWIRSKTGI